MADTKEVKESWLLGEFSKKASAAGLKVDCPSSGNPNSELVILSEAPGDREATMKMPMVGGAGQKLWTTLRGEDITRKDCYVTNVIKRQVSLSSKTEARRPVPAAELDHWEGLLDWELDQLPNVKWILCLGNYALHALLGEWGITNWRGSVIDCKVGHQRRDVKVIFAFNPALILRDLRNEPMFKYDINKLRRVIDGNFEPHIIVPRTNPSPDEAIHFIDMLSDEKKPIAFDIETIAGETACIGFANNAHEGICINFRDEKQNRFSLAEEKKLRVKIQQFLSTSELNLIAQNGTFDSYWLWYKDRIRVHKIWFDTLLAHHTLYPTMPHNLGYLTAQYTNHPYYKDEGKTWREDGNINQFWEYNVKDCCITWAAHDKLHKELQDQKLDDFFFNHVMRLQPHLIRMTVSGVLRDVRMKDKVNDDLLSDIEGLMEKFYDQVALITGDPDLKPNINSYKQMKDLYFSKLGLIGRGVKTDEYNRKRMKDHPNTSPECIDMLNMIDKLKEEMKFQSTYTSSIVDPDGKSRSEYKQYGTQKAPGRLSSASNMWKSGENLQNQPHRVYPTFIADPGYELSYFDLRQAEAKVVAHSWRVHGLIETFKRAETEEGFDVHRGNASRIFKLSYDDIPTSDWTEDLQPTKRYLGKRCVHGLNYRMQAPKLAEVCDIPLNMAFEAFAAYHRAYPEIQEAWKRIISEVKQNRMLFTPLGRRMIFLETLTDDSMDSVIAFGPQSTIGDKVSSIIYECEEDPDWPKEEARIWMNIHDALIALHKPEHGDVVRSIMQKYAHKPIIINGEPVTIFTDFKISEPDEKGIHRWSTLADYTLPTMDSVSELVS